MPEFALIAFLVKLGNAVLGYIVLRYVLFALDKKLKFDFKQWIHKDATANDKALYLACRYLGTCIFFGMLLS